jgi:hypothetical protein
LGWQGQLLKVQLEWSWVKLGRGRTLGQELGYKLGYKLWRALGQEPRWQGWLLKNQWWYLWRKPEEQENEQTEHIPRCEGVEYVTPRTHAF